MKEYHKIETLYERDEKTKKLINGKFRNQTVEFLKDNIWYFSDNDKKEYEEFFKVTHSRCYTEYGFKRTGCMGCPFNSKWQEDLEILKVKEPLLYKAVTNIFGKSYEYSLKYKEFKDMMKRNKNGIKNQK